MKPIEFIEALRESVVDSNLETYKGVFHDTPLESIKDPYWKAAVTLFQILNTNQQQIFFSILRQVQVDTVSNVLGILDGSSFLNEQNEDFVLTTTSNNEQLNGMLQDLFLALDEER